ncbi:MAG: carbon storage regulator CsrA [Bacillota bacterium]|nr:carbon storage regulator CsrA [Bacillota bacterium]
MLILTRKEQEAIVIANNIMISVLEIKDGQVRLGIKAPKDVTIYRKEIYDAIQEENKQAAAVKPASLGNILEQLKKQD